jgi:biopolymer transport protein TolQ
MDVALMPADHSMVGLFLQADIIVKSVMVFLVLASVACWAVILDKGMRLRGLNQAADAFETEVSSGRGLEDIALEAGDNPPHTLHRMLQAALFEWKEARGRGPVSEGQAAFLIQRIDRVLDAAIAREALRIEAGLSALAIVATASPFIGLFGTVWGIYHALTAIGIAGQASIDKVAGPVGEALIMTAFGLAVAVPAVMGYNWLIRRNKTAMERIRAFSGDVHNVLLAGKR